MTHANGVVTSYTYDAASQLLSLGHQFGATTINSFAYTYDKVGNRKSKAENAGTANYTYDVLNRLTQAVNPLPTNPLETFNYDPVGNRTDSNQNGLSVFNSANQLSEDANFTYQYDNNGNMTRKTAKIGGAVTQFEYDAENKLVRVVSPTNTANYKYDALGRRVEKEVIAGTTTTTRYVYDNEDILLELNGANAITARYTHGPGIDEPLVIEKGGASFFYHADGLGSITEITNQAGTVAQRYTYSSFGKIESQLDPNFVQPYTFTAREFDAETGLYFYRARYYEPSTGRFIQQDPIGFAAGDVNVYRYVVSNPVNFADPSGKFLPLAGIIPVVAGVVNGTISAITASQACDATALKILEAFGNGAVAGIVGSLVGLGVGAATGNPILAGAAGGLTSNLVEQALGDEGLDAISATAATVGGGIGGAAARRLLPLAGRVPSLAPLRTNYGPNSYRMMGQEAINKSVEGAVGAVVGGAVNAIAGSGSKGCGC